jgi:TRAP-type mannitol/chloroaromatic compound transport system substrate-binding protein
MKALIANAVDASSADMSMKAVDRYSKDYQALQQQGVKFYATPNSVLQAQLKIWDEIVARKEKENPMFKKVNDSMKAFAQRSTKWQNDTDVDFRMAANHYFSKKT